ncbi:MAG: ferritin-like domain-containing protein [Nostoc sp.]|uniref:ferritin-like domain-containing protein n=1 Tax=Nostoc sp. TaxID=1180 RepID=UPI002FFAB197
MAAKLEYGAGIFCSKMAVRAQEEGCLARAEFLKNQSIQEDSHARMLGGLVDKKARLNRNCDTGAWVQEVRSFQFLDGISQRYWAAKLFFWFRKPEELDWADTLAFMCVIESQVAKFYEILGKVDDETVRAIADKILNDEIAHEADLKDSLSISHAAPETLYRKWRNRLILAYVGGLVDLVISYLVLVA